MSKPFLAALLLCALPAAAAAQPARSIADCERIKNDLAYNQCLASFGPRVGARAPRMQAGEDPEASVARAQGGSRQTMRGRRGRKAAAFDIVTGRQGEVRRGGVTRGKSYRARGDRKRGYARRR